MGDGEPTRFSRRKPRYEGEDVSPTSMRELRGFYAYGLAAEVFAVCAVGAFLPVTLEQLARERGVLWSDKTTSCVLAKNATDAAVSSAQSLLRRAAEQQNNQCVVRVFGVEITTSSFAMYTFSLAVFIQALALVSFSSVADHGNYRKKFLMAFGFVGSISSMLFIFVVPQIFLVGSFLVIIGVTCLGSSFVILNSFLPLLVSNHPETQNGDDADNLVTSSVSLEPISGGRDRGSSGRYSHLAAPSNDLKSTDSSELALSTKISAKGVGTGYIAAVFVQILSILVLFFMSKLRVSSTLPLRLVLFMVGVWWFAFTIPSFLWLRARPGPPLSATKSTSKLHSVLSYISFAWKSLFTTIKAAIKLRQITLFLIAWFLLSDAVATVSGTAILFARTELHMDTVPIALLSITSISSGIAGAFVWPLISRKYSLPTHHVLIFCMLMMETIPIYGLLGYIPFIQSLGFGGLQKMWEIYPLGIVHGFVMGGLSSYCRSFYGRLIPPGREAAFYALYAITDKGSSAVGPAVVGYIVDKTGGIRPAFIFLAVLILIPIPIVWAIDVTKGEEDAKRGFVVTGENARHMDDLGSMVESDDDEAEGLMMNHE